MRKRCPACPWRDMEAMEKENPDVVSYAAEKAGEGFVCHVRMGPCDGPKIALAQGLIEATSDA